MVPDISKFVDYFVNEKRSFHAGEPVQIILTCQIFTPISYQGFENLNSLYISIHGNITWELGAIVVLYPKNS